MRDLVLNTVVPQLFEMLRDLTSPVFLVLSFFNLNHVDGRVTFALNFFVCVFAHDLEVWCSVYYL
jgi:hypothetical protein